MPNMQPCLPEWVVLSFMMFAAVCGTAWAADSDVPLPELTEIEPGLYRGGQPTEEGYRQLKEMGVRTIVNFRHEEDMIELGRERAAELGMDYISLPWTIYGKTRPDVLEGFLETISSEQARPVYFHCRRGVERTGVMSALYYMNQEGLSHDEAYEKAFSEFPVKWRWKLFVNQKVKAFMPHLKDDSARSGADS